MYVEIRKGAATVREAADLKSLSVHIDLPSDLVAGLHGLGEPAPGSEHVWLRIESLKLTGSEQIPADQRTQWATGFDRMIAYAASKGWTSHDGTCVRAHVVSPTL